MHMIHIITRVLVTALGLLLAAYLIPGIEVDGLYIALVSAFLLGLINLTIKPLLFVLTLPITIVTLGLFAFVLNALMFWFVASFVDGFSVDGFLPALLGSLFVSLVSAVGNKLLD